MDFEEKIVLSVLRELGAKPAGTHPPAPSLAKRGGEEMDVATTPKPPSLPKRRGLGDEFKK